MKHTVLKDKRVVLLAGNNYMSRILASLIRKFGVVEILVLDRLAQLADRGATFDPDLVILDHQLPDGDGIGFVRTLRHDQTNFRRDLPIILCSANIDRDTAVAARDNGLNEILVQPVQPDAMARKLGAIFTTERDFVIAPSYVGPDRRRKDLPDFDGKDRRSTETDGLSQDEADSIMQERHSS